MSNKMEEAIEAIKGMGITHNEDQIRAALRQSNNDPEVAVQLLFPESPATDDPPNMLSGYNIVDTSDFTRSDTSYQNVDVDMRDTETHPGSGGDSDRDSTTVSYSIEEDNLRDVEEDESLVEFRDINQERDDERGGEYEESAERHEGPPPRYEDIVSDNQGLPSLPSPSSPSDNNQQTTPTPVLDVVAPQDDSSASSSSSIEFPLTHFYQLESRVHTEQWSIPYKRDESLAVCMVAAIRMIREVPGIAETDDNLKKLLDRTMPESFRKLVTHDAVYRWDITIMEGILDMCRILMELLAERLKQPPIAVGMLNVLTMVWNADASYHAKMRSKRTEPARWTRVLGEGNVFAMMPHFQTHKDSKGWLVEIMNIFAQHGGIQAIKDAILQTENVTLQELTALFQPFSVCEDYINPPYLKAELSKCILRAMRFVHELTDESLKDKGVGCVSDLLKSIKSLLVRCSLWDMVTTVDNLRLDVTIRMLNIPHFNAKMNALKEVVRLTEEPYQAAARGVKSPIPVEKITEWLVEKKVLSIAFSGNLHQSQYCDKLKSIVEFLGTKLSVEELTTIWEMQVDKNPVQVENVHGILAAAACRFTPQHLDHLFQLIQQSWENASDRYREKLLDLIGKIGKDDRQGKTATKILDLLWGLAHLPQLSREMVELALEAHSSILIESYHTKEAEKRTYINKCIEDIRKGTWVVSGFRQLHKFAKGFFNTGYGHKDQHQIAELQRQHDLLRLTCNSLSKCHAKSVQECQRNGVELTGDMLVDGRSTHAECVDVHLKFVAFLLQDGALYIPTRRAVELWETLISNPNTCPGDRMLAFKWFDSGMGDMEHDTQVHMFNSKVLKTDPALLDLAGYHCLRNFFETINLDERKLKKISSSYQTLFVENPDLTGIDYLWKAVLEVKDTKIADELINNILQVTYVGLSQKLKKDVSTLHLRFIEECFNRLEDLLDTTGAPARTSTGRINDSALRLQAVCRLLLLAQRYIMVVDEHHPFPRYQPPHGACFLGHPLMLSISPDQPKETFKLECHSNESILSVRKKIAGKLGVTSEQVQMGTSERWLEIADNNKLVHQLGFTDQQVIIVKTHLAVSSNYAKATETKEGNVQRQALAQEQERNLPGVMMANRPEVFDKMEELCLLGDSNIISRVRSLLMLIPTDHRVVDVLDVFSHQASQGASEDPQSPPSPSTVLEDYFSPTNTTPTKLLYNLEVLSSRLIPTERAGIDELESTQLFRRTFLEAKGLKSVINVLQKNALPSDVDLDVRQDCYAIALSLARFLLCNQSLLSVVTRPPPYRQHSSASQSSGGQLQGVELAAGEEQPHPQGGGVQGGASASSQGGVETSDGERHKPSKATTPEDEVARLTIETMSVSDFATTLAYLMRVCWSAAAGQLHLASIGDSEPSSPASLRGKSQTTTTTSSSLSLSSSSGSLAPHNQLRPGICAEQENGAVSAKNAAIARESLELLVTCLKLRSHLLGIFYTLPHVEAFVVDILLGSPHLHVRMSVVEQFDQLCQTINTGGSPSPVGSSSSRHAPCSETPVKRPKTSIETPHHFFLHLLLSHPESLWDSGRGHHAHARQWERCSEFFAFRCQLLQGLRVFEQESLSVNVRQMLCQELDWFKSLQAPPPTAASNLGFQTLLAGHLRLCQALFCCEGIDRKQYGRDLALQLVAQFLFPASKMIQDTTEPHPPGIVSISPICSEITSRVAAYDLLVELATCCYDNLSLIAEQLITMHHQPDPQIAKEWEFQPPVVGRSGCGFVGLKNAGATCYMNSVLQQLYMTQPIRDVILEATSEDEVASEEGESILPELQCVFGHLLESKLQFYSPENFWKKFKLWGQPINVREQQDAFDFFCNLMDQVDEQLKKRSSRQVFQQTFGGSFLDQKICKGCDHTYEREEPYLSLSLPVKSKRSLEESLKEFVKGDLLEGDNAYFCEKCDEKRDTLKRTCIKSLPPRLVVQLKRFDYDWEANRAIKYDHYFEFPWELDMGLYTAAGIAALEDGGAPPAPVMYELTGIMVHSGQASAGHYYTFIKERGELAPQAPPTIPEEEPLETASLAPSGRWLRFNDILVDEFSMSDAALQAECFGGNYKTKATDAHSNQPETRVRYWNAYMLFYEAMVHHHKLPSSSSSFAGPRGSLPDVNPMSPLSPHPAGDKLSQLQALVQKGERRGMFTDKMPPAIQRSVNEENLQFMRHRDVYCPKYFNFILQLVEANMVISVDPDHKEHSAFGVASLQIAINFLFHTLFRTRNKLRGDLEYWVSNVERLVQHCRDACHWMVGMLGSQQGNGYLKPFLLECTSKEVRHAFSTVLSSAMHSYIGFGASTEEGPVAVVVDTLLAMLDKDVVDSSKACAEYFDFFKNYATSAQGCRHLLKKDAFVLLLDFLLGPAPKTATDTSQEKYARRWSSNQVKEFGPLHGTLSLLVRNTDISMFEHDSGTEEEAGGKVNPYMIPCQPSDLLPPSDGMHQALFTIEHSKRFIRECVLTLCESSPAATDAIAATFCYCCWNNQSFSACAIEDLQNQVSTVPSSELKSYFKVLTEMLIMEDSLQIKRISFTISGGKYQPHLSVFATIQSNSTAQSDSKKAYQGIKFLVGLANKCKAVRDFLLSRPAEWQWAVVWLRRKMSENYSWSQSSSMSNESSQTRIFQRTVSAQDTLEEANALLNELEARDSPVAAQVSGTTDSKTYETNGNGNGNMDSSNSTTTQLNSDQLEG